MSDLPFNPATLLRLQSMQMSTPITPMSTAYFNAAMKALNLTPQEQFLYQHHLNNLIDGGRVVQPTGDISTILQSVVTGPDGRYYNIPTVWGGQVLPPDKASQRAAAVGWERWPSYDTSEAADSRYEDMHQYLGEDVRAWQQANPPTLPQMSLKEKDRAP